MNEKILAKNCKNLSIDTSEKLNQAYKFMSDNNFDMAKKLSIDVIKNDPSESEAYNILSFVNNKQGNFKEAIDNLTAALKYQPNNHIYHNNISNIYKAIGDFDTAITHLNKALIISPNYAEAYNNLGSIYYKQNLPLKAISFFEKALRIHPHYFAAHLNLANCLIKEDRFTKAITHYKEALKLQPQNMEVKQNLAMAYVEENDYANSIPLLKSILKLYPYKYPQMYIHLSECLIDTGNTEEAIPILKKAIELNPNIAYLHHNIAICYLRKKKDIALKEFKTSLKLDSNNPTAEHLICALEQKSTPESSPPQFVSDLFDQYANFYTKHMTEKLKYKVPEILRSVASKFINTASGAKSILDLGCGTGLCGIYFSDLANILVGVDLAKNMLLHAKELKAYDILCQLDISEAIPGENLSYFDFILAADVFIYMGNLENIFKKCKSSMKIDGKFMFTIEKLKKPFNIISKGSKKEEDKEYILQKTGRFAHSIDYIKQLADKYNFQISYQKNLPLREENKKPIPGTLFVLENKQFILRK